MFCEQAERVLPLLYGHPCVIIPGYHDVDLHTVGYLPEQRAFIVGGLAPSLDKVTSRGIILSTPLKIELQPPDPAVVDIGGWLILYHKGRAYQVSTYPLAPAAAVVTVIHDQEAEDLASFDLPDGLRLEYPEPADVEFELSREYCTFRYYYINPKKLDSHLELTVRIHLDTERVEFGYRVVHDPERARALYELLYEAPPERPEQPGFTHPTGVIIHSLAGTRVAYLAFNLPQSVPFLPFVRRTVRVCEEAYSSYPSPHEAPILDLLTWWLEWRLQWSNVQLPPVKDERDRYCHDLLTQPWLAALPDLLAATSSLAIILPLARFEHWWFERLKSTAEKLRARGLLGQFLMTVAYYAPVGLLEELLGRLVLPHLVRLALTPFERLLPWLGRVDSNRLADRALYCAVAPVVDTLAMRRAATLAGSPVIAALVYALLDELWRARGHWFEPRFWLLEALALAALVPFEAIRGLLWLASPPPLAALLYALYGAGVNLLPPSANLNLENQHRLICSLLTPLLEQLTEMLTLTG
ncbi:MAG: hypothetical protein ABGY09_06205 [Euryarchaeota archaeon]